MKKIFSILLCLFLISGMTACKGNSEKIAYKSNEISYKNLFSAISIDYDENTANVVLSDKSSEKIWSTEINDAEIKNNSVKSPINIKVSNNENLSWEIVNGYDACVAQGNVTAEKTNNGYLLKYYFEAYGITIPVKYEIINGVFKTTVLVNKITEKSTYKLVSVSLSPNLCSVKNNSENSYLFIPTGSGALMDTNENVSGARTYQGEIFGQDYGRLVEEYLSDDEIIRLPVFAAKSNNNSLFCIIESGAESATLNATAGDSSIGFSNVYPEFFVRGYDIYAITSATAYLGGTEYRMISDEKTSINPSVSYYSFSGEESEYSNMASFYRSYLLETKQLTKSEYDDFDCLVSFIGGIQIKETTLGVPHYSTEVLTNYSDIKSILSDISKVDSNLAIRMVGYGESGITPGKVAGNFKLSDIFGSTKEFDNLKQFCKDNNQLLSIDYDLIRFNKSGNGFSNIFDTAKTASSRVATLYPVNPILRTNYKDNKYYLLSKSNINTVVSKLLDKCKKQDTDAVSLFSYTEMLYSDYNSAEYYLRNNSNNQISDSIKALQKNGIGVLGSSNYYSSIKSDLLLNVPIDNGGYYCFSQSVPFYQMVFHGYKPLYSSELNASDDLLPNVLKALSTGTNLSFSFIGNYDTRIQTADMQYVDIGSYNLYSLLYKTSSKSIKKAINKCKDVYEKVSDAQIVSYNFENDISITKYSNGLVLYVNHSSEKKSTDIGDLNGYSFKLVSQS